MTLLDGIVLAVAALAAIRGLFRGFVKEAFALLAWIGGLLLAILYAPEWTDSVGKALGIGAPLDGLVTGVLFFLGVYVILRLTGWILQRLVHAAFLGPVDRFAGLLLGGAKGLFVCAFLLWIAATQRLAPSIAEPIEAAPVAGMLLEVARETRDALGQAARRVEPERREAS